MIQSERRGRRSELVCGGGEDGMTDCGGKGVSIIHSLPACVLFIICEFKPMPSCFGFWKSLRRDGVPEGGSEERRGAPE